MFHLEKFVSMVAFDPKVGLSYQLFVCDIFFDI